MRRFKRKAAPRAGDAVFYTVVVAIFCMLVFVCLYPFYYVAIYSLSNPKSAIAGVTLLPRDFSLFNYQEVLKLPNIYNAAFISVMRTVIGATLTVACCSLFGFLVTKQKMYFRRFIYRLVIITMYFNSGLVPWFLTMKMFKLSESFLLYIIPSAVSAYYTVLFKTFMEQLPSSLEESARLDGAGIMTAFTRIIFPLSKPIVATIAVFAAVAQWNSWFDNYVLVARSSLKTLQLVLYEALNRASAIAADVRRGGSMSSAALRSAATVEITPQSIRMTITMVVTLPILFIYPLMQRHFIKGIMLGAIKG